MTRKVTKTKSPADEEKKDPNDFRDDPAYKSNVETIITKQSGKKPKPDMGWLSHFKLTKEEANELAEPEWIYKDLIVKSHLIVIPAAPGAGKTTILMAIAGELAEKGYDVVYVNADVGGGDVKAMQIMADEKGFHLLLPDMKAGLSMDNVVQKLYDMNDLDVDYSNSVFFFDTLKKMTDIISKNRSKELYKVLRGLTAKGMTIILLAHTNKYDDIDGNPIYEGTGDLRSDVDDLIYLVPKENPDGSLTVSTDPLSATAKRRGTHQPITFHISPSREVTRHKDYVDTAAQLKADRLRTEDASIIEAITEGMLAGKNKQMELIDWCRKQHSIGRPTTERVLKNHLSSLWKRERGLHNNAWLYELLDDKGRGL